MVSVDYSSDSSEDEIMEWRMQELRDEVYSIADATPDGVNRDGEEKYLCWDYPGNPKFCICGKDAPQYTCWWLGNHFGRRYYGCRNWCNRKCAYTYCTYFEWEDPPMNERSQELITRLNDEIIRLENSQSSLPAPDSENPALSLFRMMVAFTVFLFGVCLGVLAWKIVN